MVMIIIIVPCGLLNDQNKHNCMTFGSVHRSIYIEFVFVQYETLIGYSMFHPWINAITSIGRQTPIQYVIIFCLLPIFSDLH